MPATAIRMSLLPGREQLLDRLERLAAYRPSPVARRVLGATALVVFLVSLGVAFRHLPTLDLRPELLLVVVLGAAIVFGVNAAELRIAGHLSRRPLAWLDAAEKTLWATAANLLPLPGGPLIRLQAVADRPGRGPRNGFAPHRRASGPGSRGRARLPVRAGSRRASCGRAACRSTGENRV